MAKFEKFKRCLTACMVLALTFTVGIADAKSNVTDLTLCDYDSLFYGAATLEENEGHYTLSTGDEMYNYTYKGSVDDVLYIQAKAVLDVVKPDAAGMKNIILLTSLDEPVCATTAKTESLYVQPGLIEKINYYVVGVCLPESDACWKLKINKLSPLAMTIKNNILPEEGKTCMVTYSPDKSILNLYVDENAE